MLSELSWETLEQRRAKTRAVDLMYKIINNLVDIPSHTLLIPADGRTRGTTVYRVIYTRIDAILLFLSAYHTHLESHTSRT
jgi:hypothetical protein